MDSARKQIALLSGSAALAKPGMLIGQKRTQLEQKTAALKNSADAAMAANYARIETLSERLAALDPLAVLRRGYAIVTDEEKRPVMSAEGVLAGQRLNITLADGNIAAKAEQIEIKKKTEPENAEERI